ncbi:hypothetical protein XGA_5116 [Xanthomonas hortorum ATCC 19865]|nr:hypothetical protein XGA_5116 [Xanthomonas hortorum ATCC 19865]
MLTTDSKEQIVHPIEIAIDGRSATVINRNEIATLIFLSFVVEDTDKKILFSCDPQVGNDPKISPR